jgi:hypothetical protein
MHSEDSLRRKRQRYKRSHTLASLPAHHLNSALRQAGAERDDPLLQGSLAQCSRGGGSAGSSQKSLDMDQSWIVERQRGGSSHGTGARRQSRGSSSSQESHGPSAGGRGGLASGASTPGPSVVASAQPANSGKKLGRTPSSPSVLFSKVKERIREKVGH